MLIIFWVNHKSISCVHIHPHHLSSIVIYHYVSSPINYHHVSSCIVVSSCIITPLTYPLRKKGHDIIVYHHGASSNLESPHLGLRGRRVGQHFNSLQEFGRTATVTRRCASKLLPDSVRISGFSWVNYDSLRTYVD